MIIPEQLHIGLKNVEIGERTDVIVEVDPVIPDKNIFGYFCPTFHVLHKYFPGAIFGQAHFPITVNITKHYIYIWERFNMFRGSYRKEVSQGGEFFVGESGSQLIQKPDNTS